MFTNMLYEAERDRTAREQREINELKGELALALMRPFRWLTAGRRTAGPATRQRPPAGEQPRLRVGAFPSEPTVSQARCN